MNIKRGQIYYVAQGYATGCEMRAGRPGIVVSNDTANAHSPVVEVVYLTTHPKKNLPTHVTIRSLARESTALCEQVTSVSTDRLGRCMGEVTEAEMQSLEIAMLISLGLRMERPKTYLTNEETDRVCAGQELDRAGINMLRRELDAERAKRKALQWAYESLVAQILKKEESVC